MWKGLRGTGEDLGEWERLGRVWRGSGGVGESGEGVEEVWGCGRV